VVSHVLVVSAAVPDIDVFRNLTIAFAMFAISLRLRSRTKISPTSTAATGQVRSTWTITEIIRYRVTWFEWTLQESHKLKTLVVEVNFDTDPNTTDLRHWTKFETSSAVL